MEPLPSSDLDTYASRYYGRGKILRLQHIASHSPKLRKEALLLALAETKAETRDVELYKRLLERLKEVGQVHIPLESEWETSVVKEDSKEVERLETELQRYRHNMIKDSIRMAYGDLGDFQYSKGNLEEALRNYLKMRDYCVSSQQITDMCLKIIQCAIILGNFSLVESYVQKAEQTPEIANDEKTQAKLQCALGLALLSKRKLKAAAERFLQVSFALQDSFNEILAPEDVSTLGSICALATFDRKELKRKLLDNKPFKEFLELTPNIRELINDFYFCHYGKFFERLQRMEPDWRLDLYFYSLVDTVMELIRDKALIQYVMPYTCVYLDEMAKVFCTDVYCLQDELAKLITSHQIQGRIDSHRKILYAKEANKRNSSILDSLSQGTHLVDQAESMLLHIKMLKHRLSIRATSATEQLYDHSHSSSNRMDWGSLHGE
ncbi:hypothetical protein GpartN1_g6962.t1 [Galdieria partita]|uniref:PCI domain-containing protein n=1 Tax=Galdieria partita TaxID=83374 RepID=A0A9C7Q2T1_9RHOD|nr:hypothetical protein GpartN1_g6962.t1 [Galdieria partita]